MLSFHIRITHSGSTIAKIVRMAFADLRGQAQFNVEEKASHAWTAWAASIVELETYADSQGILMALVLRLG